MPKKDPAFCARPTGGPMGAPNAAGKKREDSAREDAEQGGKNMIQVGQKAPDFEAPAYFQEDFTAVKLSEHLGKWIVLCFYPGDFTFV